VWYSVGWRALSTSTKNSSIVLSFVVINVVLAFTTLAYSYCAPRGIGPPGPIGSDLTRKKLGGIYPKRG